MRVKREDNANTMGEVESRAWPGTNLQRASLEYVAHQARSSPGS
jgi:hypothetical protein